MKCPMTHLGVCRPLVPHPVSPIFFLTAVHDAFKLLYFTPIRSVVIPKSYAKPCSLQSFTHEILLPHRASWLSSIKSISCSTSSCFHPKDFDIYNYVWLVLGVSYSAFVVDGIVAEFTGYVLRWKLCVYVGWLNATCKVILMLDAMQGHSTYMHEFMLA